MNINMNTWMSSKSIYESIDDTVPSGKYDCEIQRILQEEKEGGTYEFLKGRLTFFDLDIQKRLLLKEKTEASLVAVKKQIEQSQSQSLSPKDVDALFLKRYALEDEVRYHEQFYSDITYVEKIWNQYYTSLRVIVNKFRQTKDIGYLRKGAHILGEYRDYLLQDTEVCVRKQLLIEILRGRTEFQDQLDLHRQSLPALLKLFELLDESKKRGKYRFHGTSDKGKEIARSRFLTDAILYLKTNSPSLFQEGIPVEVQTEHHQVDWDIPAPPEEEQVKQKYIDTSEEKANDEAEEDDYLYRSVKWSSGK